ncbi:CHASE2 domain-containing protein [Roseateles chitinivorans]|uniref:CHASE2 domain-containing protein n=1 Tax=Roseateles chitinivorans TaxID=2917965 RepID=UPI003D66DC95
MAETGARLPRVAWLVPIVAMLAAMTLLVHDPVPLRVARNAVFDQFQRWYPRPYLAPSVRIVDIDEESLRRFGQWPWSRAQVARLLDAAQQLEPASVSLDIMFPEPEGQTRADTGGNASDDPDQSLAQALRSGRVALGVALTGPRLGATQRRPPAGHCCPRPASSPSAASRPVRCRRSPAAYPISATCSWPRRGRAR